jgi:hypothetical protein
MARRPPAPRLAVRPRRREALHAGSGRPGPVHPADRTERPSLGSGCRRRWRKPMGIELAAHVIGPRRDIVDHHGDWARARESRRRRLRAGAAGPARGLARRGTRPRTPKQSSPGCLPRSCIATPPPPARRRSERSVVMDTARTGILHRRELRRRRDRPQRQGAE